MATPLPSNGPREVSIFEVQCNFLQNATAPVSGESCPESVGVGNRDAADPKRYLTIEWQSSVKAEKEGKKNLAKKEG